jgi:hypothetical protein
LPVSTYADHRIAGATLVILIAQNVLLTLLACYFILDTGAHRSTAVKD